MNILLFIAIVVVVSAVIYILYCQGFAVLRRTTAIIIVFRHGKNADEATLDACTGWVKHVGRFRESKTYEFFFDAQLSKGNVEVILLDRKKQQLILNYSLKPVIQCCASHNYCILDYPASSLIG